MKEIFGEITFEFKRKMYRLKLKYVCESGRATTSQPPILMFYWLEWNSGSRYSVNEVNSKYSENSQKSQSSVQKWKCLMESGLPYT